MASNVFKELNIPEARLLADLTGMSYDFERARDFATRLKSALVVRSTDSSLVEPLTIASIVQYCRPFAGGKRTNLNSNLLATFSETQKAKHDWIRATRDKHIAHSVNTFEESQPIARYWLERVDKEGVTSVECNHSRVIGLSQNDADAIVELSTVLLDHIGTLLKEEKVKILEIVRKMPLDTILKGPYGSPYSPIIQDPNEPRR